MHVTFWIRAEYAGDALCGVLSDGRIKAAERIQAERKARRQETDLLDCLQFAISATFCSSDLTYATR